MKIVHIEIKDNCEECPYLRFDPEWGSWDCKLGEHFFIHDLDRRKYEWEIGIPDWCPLPEYKEGGKF
jgi:hypothetical protein